MFSITAQSVQALTYSEITAAANLSANSLGTPRILGASTVSVSVGGVTNTQAVLSYTAPDNNACTVKVSENSSLAPLVHDVDPALFTGSNLDSRPEAINNATKRIFVVGKRTTEKAVDGNNYSRALQAYTTHYYEVTCGTAVASGSFTTANIPFQMTYQDIPQLDPANPGSTIVPTLGSSRTTTIVDPHTGALIQRVSLPADTSASGPFMYFGGFTRICSDNLMGSPAIGFLCSFSNGEGGFGVLYYIIPSTGQARYLGRMPDAYPFINPIDGKFYSQSGDNLNALTYSGNYNAVPADTQASLSSATVITGISTAVHAFDSSFVVADFGCGVGPAIGRYVSFTCRRGIQDSYGWQAVFDLTTGLVVAAMNLNANVNYRWTGIHAVSSAYDAPALFITTHGLEGGGSVGVGPYVTTYSGGATLPAGSTSLTVSGEPSCSGCGADAELPLAQPGDKYTFLDTNETVTLVTKNSPTSWVITPTASSHVSGATIKAAGNYVPLFWKFLLDPHGTDTTNAYVVQEPQLDGHLDMTTGSVMMETWSVRSGDLLAKAGQPWTASVNNAPSFAGASGQCYGNGCASHPSAGPPGSSWFTDFLRWDGAGADAGTISGVSGQLYKFTGGYGPASPKQMATASLIGANWTAGGPKSFLNVSGPGVTLGTGPSDSYKYCIANAAGECRAGSAKGDTYVNIPGSPATMCGQYGAVCLNNFDAWGNAVLQVGTSGNATRVISGGLAALARTNNYPTAKALADGSWLLFTIGDTQYNTPSHLVMAKLPPFAAQDSVDRTTFIRAPVAITTPSGRGIASASVDFGYTEQGTTSQYYCTSRRESCTVTSGSVNDSNPFNYSQTDSYTPTPCSSSCTIVLPVLPMHVAYYQVKFYDSSGTLVALGDQGVAAESAITTIAGSGTPPADTIPPVLSSIATSGTTAAGTTISWTTDELSDTQVDYGTTSSYGSSTSLNTSLSTSHNAILSSLSASTLYHYRVKSRDAAGNLAVSADQTFTTSAAPLLPDTTVPTVSISAPINLATVSGASVSLAAAAVDPTPTGPASTVSGVRDVQFKIDGVNLTTITSSPYTTTWNSTSVSNGTHSISAIAVDNAGNISTTATVTVTVNNVTSLPPVPTLGVTVVASPSSGTVPVNNVSLTATVNGTATGNVNYYFYCNRNDTTTSTSTVPDSKSLNDSAIAKTVSNICSYSTAGTYTAKVIVERAGAPASESRANVIVSAVPVTPPPSPVTPAASQYITNFSITPANGQLSLFWTLVSNANFVKIQVVRKQGSYPTTSTDGALVYEGTGSSYVDKNLTNGTPYYYSLFAVLQSGVLNSPSQIGTSVPGAPSVVSAIPGAVKLVNQNNTYYLIQDGIKHGITNPGMLTSFGFSLSDAVVASSQDSTLPEGSLLLPGDGSLVKSKQDPTVYLVSGQQRYSFTSASVFFALGFKFSSVLVVTDPELQALPKSSSLVNNGSSLHLPGLDINRNGTVYWIGGDNRLHGYPDLATYNSWHVKNDFSKVVPANSADASLPVGEMVVARVVR